VSFFVLVVKPSLRTKLLAMQGLGSHTPPEDRQARLSGVRSGYLRQ